MLISERYSYGASKIMREVLKHINVKLMHVKKVHNNFLHQLPKVISSVMHYVSFLLPS